MYLNFLLIHTTKYVELITLLICTIAISFHAGTYAFNLIYAYENLT